MTWDIEINVTSVGKGIKQIVDILNKEEYAVVTIGNTSANRTLVASDNPVTISYNAVDVFEGFSYAPEPTKSGTIELTAYKDVYKELDEGSLTADYSAGETANNILAAVATEVGINAGSCPSTTVYVNFVGANTRDIVEYLAKVLETDYYCTANSTINVGSKGTSKGTITSYANNSFAGVDRAKQRNHVLLRGFDADNSPILGEAYWDAGNTTIVKGTPPGGYDKRTFTDTDRQSKTEEMLENHAADTLEEMRREASGSKLFVFVNQGYNLYSGDTITVNDTDLSLSGSYRIFKVVKMPAIVEVHVDRLFKETSDHILDLRKYKELGIFIAQNADDLIENVPNAPTGFDASDISPGTGLHPDGTVGSFFRVVIPRVSEAVQYGLRYKISTESNYTTVYVEQRPAGNAFYYINYVKPGETYNFQVCSVGKLGGQSDWTPVTPVDKLALADSSAPATPTGFTATGLYGKIELVWDENTEDDLAHYIVYKNTVNNSGTATAIARVLTTRYTVLALRSEFDQTRYFWIKAVDTSGNASGFSLVASAAATHVESLDVVEGIQAYESNLEFIPKVGDTNDSVSWGAGTIQFADGTTQSISSGDASNLSPGVYYIYFTVGYTTLGTTTVYGNTIGDDVGLLCLIKVSTDTDQEVLIFPFRSKGLNINADVIAAQAVIAAHIKAGAVTVSKYNSSPWHTNLIADGDFESGDHTQEWAVTSGTWTTVTSPIHLGKYAVRVTGDGGNRYLRSQTLVPCREGEVYHISGWHRHDTGDVGNSRIILDVYDEDKVLIGFVQNLSGNPSTTWTKREGRYRVANSNYAYLGVRLGIWNDMGAGEYAYFDDVTLQRLDYTGGTASQARVEMFPDANTGLQVVDSGGTPVLEVLVGGTNQGDVTIGDYAGNQGVQWDESAGNFNIRGNLNADNATITNLIATHFKTGESVQSGYMDSTTILNLDYPIGAFTTVNSSYVVLRTGTASNESDAINVAVIDTTIFRDPADSHESRLKCKLEFGSTIIQEWTATLTDNATYEQRSTIYIGDLSGQTIDLEALCLYSSENGIQVKGKITVYQYKIHSHDIPP